MQFRMEGAGMEPTLHDGNVLDVLRYDRPVASGDLIVFHAPTSPSREFLKRVVAGPGQTVSIAAGKASVDGQALTEPYIQGTTECFEAGCTFVIPDAQPAVPNPGASPLSVSPGAPQPECETSACYFVLGDNRMNSSDSRGGWLVPVQNIIGYVRAG